MNLSEKLAQPFGRLAFGRTTDKVRTVVIDDIGQFPAVIQDKLSDALKPQNGGDLVFPPGIDNGPQ